MKSNSRFPEDSGPNISTILPLGIPPTPKAISRLNEPVEMVERSLSMVSPSFMIEPLPNCFCI